jgi:hypothetical protein
MQYSRAVALNAVALIRTRELRDDGSIIEMVVWQLAVPVPPCTHHFKYRLYFGSDGISRVRYDNERGKGDHRHLGEQEDPYLFVSVERLLADFCADVLAWEQR